MDQSKINEKLEKLKAEVKAGKTSVETAIMIAYLIGKQTR